MRSDCQGDRMIILRLRMEALFSNHFLRTFFINPSTLEQGKEVGIKYFAILNSPTERIKLLDLPETSLAQGVVQNKFDMAAARLLPIVPFPQT